MNEQPPTTRTLTAGLSGPGSASQRLFQLDGWRGISISLAAAPITNPRAGSG